jgi:hypothetical protein
MSQVWKGDSYLDGQVTTFFQITWMFIDAL